MTGEDRFFIGELAERCGVSRDAIRYYEDAGVLPEPARTRGGYRLYDADDVDRLRFVGRAQTLGLTLEEIADVLEIVDRGRDPCVHVRERVAVRLAETRERIAELRALEARLEDALERAGTARDAGDGCRCEIIEAVERPGVRTETDAPG